jgi:hypothetical protein
LIVDAGGLPSQEPEVLVEARREVRVDAARDLAPARTHPEPVLSGGADIDVNAHLTGHVPDQLSELWSAPLQRPYSNPDLVRNPFPAEPLCS